MTIMLPPLAMIGAVFLDREKRHPVKLKSKVVGDIVLSVTASSGAHRGRAGVGEHDIDDDRTSRSVASTARSMSATLPDIGAKLSSSALAVEFLARRRPAAPHSGADQNHMSAFGLKRLRGFQTNTGRAARDECNFVCELRIVACTK